MKFFITLFFTLFFSLSVNAITWEKVSINSAYPAYIDTDSIVENGKYCFYNIKVYDASNHEIVHTVQTSLANSFSSINKNYMLGEYEKLNGDYENIAKHPSGKFEFPVYNSRIYLANKKARSVINTKTNKVHIIN